MVLLKEITDFIKAKTRIRVLGSLDLEINNIHSINYPIGGGLSFCIFDPPKSTQLIQDTKAKAIIIRNQLSEPIQEKTIIEVDNPRLWFIRVANRFFPPKEQTDIHPTAIINHSCVKMGKNVKIGPGCTIGFDGFGYEKNENGEYEKFPHYGRVIIGDDVEICANVNIDRGALGDTVIGSGTKIDSLAHIAHNVEIGKNCIIVCLTCLAGGAKIGDGAWVAPLAGVREGIEVGENALVGMGAIVIKDVAPEDVVAGVPAKSIKKVNPDD